MNEFVKKILKILLIFIISVIIIYLIFTFYTFGKWCNENQIELFKTDNSEQMLQLDSEKIQNIGNDIRERIELYESGLEDSAHVNISENHTIDDGHSHTFAEFYDTVGLSVWTYMQFWVSFITTKHCTMSILLGIVITLAYLVITSKKINNTLKIVIGYLSVILIAPPIYMYSWSHRFWSISEMYLNTDSRCFYIVYTPIFVSIFIINYVINQKSKKED